MEQAQYTLNNSPPQGRPSGVKRVRRNTCMPPTQRKLPKYVVQEPSKCCHLAQSKFIQSNDPSLGLWLTQSRASCKEGPQLALEPRSQPGTAVKILSSTMYKKISTLEWWCKKTCQHEKDRPQAIPVSDQQWYASWQWSASGHQEQTNEHEYSFRSAVCLVVKTQHRHTYNFELLPQH